jgi:DNA-binding HxlR family transcriptional regulator
MMQRCVVQTAVDAVGGKWKPGILFRLQGRTIRFADLVREMPWISERVLIRQLRELEADGIVARTDHGTRPPRVEYSMTDYGETLRPLLAEMGRWGAGHLQREARRKAAE